MKTTSGSTVVMLETEICFETLGTVIRLYGVTSHKTTILKDKFVLRGMSSGSRLEVSRVFVTNLRIP